MSDVNVFFFPWKKIHKMKEFMWIPQMRFLGIYSSHIFTLNVNPVALGAVQSQAGWMYGV